MQNLGLLEAGKNSDPILSRLSAKVYKIWDNVRDPSFFRCFCPIVYIMFRSVDIPHQVSNTSKKRPNINSFWPPVFGRDDPNFSTFWS